MIDPTPPDGSPPTTPQAASPDASIALVVNAQYLKDLSFENPRAPQVFAGQGQPQVQVGVDVGARQLGESAYEVTLVLNAEAKAGGETSFVVEITYAGLFTVPAIPPEALRPLLLIECPRLLFPFARQIVADATRDGGFPPLMVSPIDFADLYRRQHEAPATPASSPAPTA
ncbi:MAG: protein-export chaperone SecB [Rhodospirillales bacterium]|nr:protein-export chaperone SecB [Rhodospirillales bacterium]